MPRYEALKDVISTVNDYPKIGVRYRNILPLLADPTAFALAVQGLMEPFVPGDVDQIVPIDGRGNYFGGAMAVALGAGAVAIRRADKMPEPTYKASSESEYGKDRLAIPADLIQPGQRVAIVDDVIATGGTGETAFNLCQLAGADVIAFCAVVDLPELGGSRRLRELGIPLVHTLVSFSESE